MQASIVVSDGTGLEVRTAVNQALSTIAMNFLGATAPTPTYPGMTWLDTSNINPKIWMRDVIDVHWIHVATLIKDVGTNTYIYRLANIATALGYTPADSVTTVNGHALTANIIISASDLTTGTLSVASGGTGAGTAPSALASLGALPTAGGNMSGNLGLKTYAEQIASRGNVSGAVQIDWSTGNIQKLTLIGTTNFTFTNAVAGQSVTIFLTQDSTGSRLVTWSAIKWVGAAPTLSTGANRVDVVVVLYDGTNYYGFIGGIGF